MKMKISARGYLAMTLMQLSPGAVRLLSNVLILAVLIVISSCGTTKQAPLDSTVSTEQTVCPAPLFLMPPPPTKNRNNINWTVHVIDGVTYASVVIDDYKKLAINNRQMQAWRDIATDQLKQYMDQKQVIIKVEKKDQEDAKN